MTSRFAGAAALSLLTALARPNAVDRNFVRDAAQGNRAMAQFGRLALKRGHSASLRDYGTRLISDHGHMQDALVKLAASDGVSAPSYLKPMDQRLYAHLDRLRGKAFDAAFKESVVKEHNRAIRLYEHEIRHGRDPGYLDYARTNLPKIREHRDALRGIGA